jgi:hypothetical protein
LIFRRRDSGFPSRVPESLAGPFRDDHAAALALVDRCRDLAVEYDPTTWFDAFGTARTPYRYDRPGAFNDKLGL